MKPAKFIFKKLYTADASNIAKNNAPSPYRALSSLQTIFVSLFFSI